jgi:N-acetyl-alpha-D-muramate 1-phosphate uridylyltransferase
MQTVILAGGLATRLRPITEKIPKALIEINGIPFIDYQLNYLKKQGIKNVVLCTGFLAEKIVDYVGNGSRYGLKVVYSNDGEKLLGTGGAIKNAARYLDDDFFILYGDSFLPVEFNPIYNKFKHNKLPALMTILENNNQWDKSNVIFDGKQINLYDKKNYTDQMNYIDYGLSICKKDIFTKLTYNMFDLAEVFTSLSKESQLDFYEVHQRFYEIGSQQGIEDFSNFALKEFTQ